MSEKVLVIDRRKWQRGDGSGELLSPFGFMCCLGFDALANWLRPFHIRERGDPVEVSEFMTSRQLQARAAYFTPRVKTSPSGSSMRAPLVQRAIVVNDNTDISDTVRERRLIPILKKLGGYRDVKFVN